MSTMQVEKVWREIICELERHIDHNSLGNWFSNLQLKDVNDSAITIETPNSFISDWITRNYNRELNLAALSALGREVSVTFEVNPSLVEMEPNLVANHFEHDSEPGHFERDAASGTSNKSIHPRHRPYPENLNPKYSFENFVVGRSNQFAYAACQAVAEKKAKNYNPLFIYGGVGLGKTHLLNAVGNRLFELQPSLKIICIQAETFMNEMIHALRNEGMEQFRRHYRKECDILLMDDIEIIAGKERTQEEFFYTFNELYLAGKKIVMTSDKFPKEMTTLEERLRSRFESGIIVDIQPPEFETRLSILRHISEIQMLNIPDKVAVYIAERISGNVRKLEGTLIRLGAVSSLSGSPVTVDLAEEVIRAVLDDPGAGVGPEDVMKRTAAYFKIKVSDLKSPNRKRKFTVPRQIAMFLCRELCNMSFPEIGASFGGRDHSTVIHSCRKIGVEKNTDAELARHIDALRRQLQG